MHLLNIFRNEPQGFDFILTLLNSDADLEVRQTTA